MHGSDQQNKKKTKKKEHKKRKRNSLSSFVSRARRLIHVGMYMYIVYIASTQITTEGKYSQENKSDQGMNGILKKTEQKKEEENVEV